MYCESGDTYHELFLQSVNQIICECNDFAYYVLILDSANRILCNSIYFPFPRVILGDRT
jgi:hypothetical protein